VVEEWVANLIEHGDAPADVRIGLSLSMRCAHVRIAVTDGGRPFDPRDVAFEGPNRDRGGGAGLELIRTWCRIAGYHRRGGRNRLLLELPIQVGAKAKNDSKD